MLQHVAAGQFANSQRKSIELSNLVTSLLRGSPQLADDTMSHAFKHNPSPLSACFVVYMTSEELQKKKDENKRECVFLRCHPVNLFFVILHAFFADFRP